MAPHLALSSTLIGSNYPCLELIFMVPNVFEPMKFDYINKYFRIENGNKENRPTRFWNAERGKGMLVGAIQAVTLNRIFVHVGATCLRTTKNH